LAETDHQDSRVNGEYTKDCDGLGNITWHRRRDEKRTKILARIASLLATTRRRQTKNDIKKFTIGIREQAEGQMVDAMISQQIRNNIVRRAGSVKTQRELADVIYSELLDANVNPQTIPLSDLKSVLVEAIRVAPASALPHPVSVAV
jgi:hypothetical protein